MLKRTFDFVFGICALIATLPVIILSALMVYLEDGLPVIFRQKRVGKDGQVFEMFKIRTMVKNAEELRGQVEKRDKEGHLIHKAKDDPRVTRVGRLLRRFSLDELPQLINVLKRDMSLVGPRMISPEEVAMYKQFDMNLFTVLPGITGLWQVSGRSDISYNERVRLDMYYVRNWSLWLDLQVLFQTLPAVLRGRGAY